MSKLDDILEENGISFGGGENGQPEGYYIGFKGDSELDTNPKQQIKDLMLELADQVELETDITTGIPDAIALLRQKVNEL